MKSWTGPPSQVAVGRFHARHGTTGWLPTSLTVQLSCPEPSIRAVSEVRVDSIQGGSVIQGMYLEGPFISPDKVNAKILSLSCCLPLRFCSTLPASFQD